MEERPQSELAPLAGRVRIHIHYHNWISVKLAFFTLSPMCRYDLYTRDLSAVIPNDTYNRN